MPMNIPSDTGPLVYGLDGLLGVGNEKPTEKLDVVGNAKVSGTLDVTGALGIGDTTVTGTFDVTGNSTITGTADIIGDTTVTGTFDADGDATVTGTLGITGVLTPTGGVAAAGGFTAAPRCIHTGGISVTQTTDGNDTTPVITETYISEVFIPANMSITGIAIFNGSAVGTDNLVVALYNSLGVVVANSLLTGTLAVGPDAFQRIVFTQSYAAKGPATYYVGLQVDGTTYRFNSHIVGNFSATKKTGETFGTLTTITPVTTFTTAQGPIASLY